MSEKLDVDTKVSTEGRVVIPAAVRSILGIGPGDRVRFVVNDGEVKLVTAQSLMFAVWANNHGGDAGDAVAAVRAERRADTARTEAKWDRLAMLEAAENRTPEQIEQSLLERLGLPL